MILLILVWTCIVLIYRYTTRSHDYWAKRNVKHDRPLPFFGNHLPNFLVRRTVTDIGVELYNKYKGEKIVGYYRGNTPELIIRDPEIVKHILTVDFKSFPDRTPQDFFKNDPLLQNMVFMNGEKWRSARQQMSPGMSRIKLRGMFPKLLECVQKLERTVEVIAARQEDTKSYDLMIGYTLACIGFCGFGVDLKTISAESSNFADEAKRFFSKSKQKIQMLALGEIIPEIASLFSTKIINKELETVVMDMARNIRKQRNWKPSGRNDFMDILLEMEVQRKFANGNNPENGLEKEHNDGESEERLLYASIQLFLLLIGGFETTATAMSTTFHYLAYHPDIQLKIQEEIDRVLVKCDNELTFESLDEMTLLEMAFKESMRLLSPFGYFRRTTAEKYTLPGTGVTIDPGVRIMIPTQALHMDPNYFDNPEEFRPERFSPESGKQNANYKYMAFGEGPRKCIGSRMAHMMATTAMTSILHRFTAVPAATSQYKFNIKKTSFLAQVVEGGLPLRFIPRK